MAEEGEEDVHKVLIDHLSHNQGLRIGHLNANGLKKKLSEICLLLTAAKFDIVAVTETHLSSEITNSEIKIEGYNITRTDRKNGNDQWGGTLIYYSDVLESQDWKLGITENKVESTWIDISVKSQRLLIGCIYRPPNDKKFLSCFSSILDNICQKRKNILLMGDFNLDLTANRTSNSNNSLIYDFRRLLYTHNLKNIIDAPT